MNKLENMFKMQEKITIYVPSTNNVNQVIDNSKYVDHAMFLLSNLFGGATSEHVKGAYVSDNGQLVKEDVTKVYAFGNDIQDKLDDVVSFCEYLQHELSQECIGLEYNNQFYLVDTRIHEQAQAI